MLLFGYLGEALIISPWAGFAVGMAGWAFTLFEIFMAEAGKTVGTDMSPAVGSAYNTMRFIALLAGPSTLLVTSLDTFWVQSLMLLST